MNHMCCVRWASTISTRERDRAIRIALTTAKPIGTS